MVYIPCTFHSWLAIFSVAGSVTTGEIIRIKLEAKRWEPYLKKTTGKVSLGKMSDRWWTWSYPQTSRQ
jgi:hypothetical protein